MSTPAPSTKSQVIMAHIFCVAQQFTSVTVYVLGKKIMDTVDVYHLVFIRLLFVIPLVLIAASVFTRKLSAFKMPLKTWGYIAASGLIGIFISQSLSFAGLGMSTATSTSVISKLTKEKEMNVPKGFGFLSSIIGALLLLQVWNFEFKGKTFGNLLIVGSAVCNALNSIIQKQTLNEGHHPLVIQFYVCCVGLVSYIAGYTWLGLFVHKSWIIPGNVWIYICIVGVVATAIPWCVSIIALKHTSPMTTILQPLIAGFVGFLLLGEKMTGIQLVGGGLVILGLVLVNAQPIVQRLFYRTKVDFSLLPTEETKEIELEIITETPKTSEGDAKPTEEVKYELTPKGETNAFVIEDDSDKDKDGADYKPVDGIFTPEFVRQRHEHEEAEGDNFSVTLLQPPAALSADVTHVITTHDDEADYKDGADYLLKEPTDYYASSCKEKILEPLTPTLRPIV